MCVAVKYHSHQELVWRTRGQRTPEAGPRPGEAHCSGKLMFKFITDGMKILFTWRPVLQSVLTEEQKPTLKPSRWDLGSSLKGSSVAPELIRCLWQLVDWFSLKQATVCPFICSAVCLSSFLIAVCKSPAVFFQEDFREVLKKRKDHFHRLLSED